MVRYRRNRVQGGTYFFTVTLGKRQSTALVDHVSVLRAAFRVARQERPFTIDAIVILPDHLTVVSDGFWRGAPDIAPLIRATL
jgi:putative transposase